MVLPMVSWKDWGTLGTSRVLGDGEAAAAAAGVDLSLKAVSAAAPLSNEAHTFSKASFISSLDSPPIWPISCSMPAANCFAKSSLPSNSSKLGSAGSSSSALVTVVVVFLTSATTGFFSATDKWLISSRTSSLYYTVSRHTWTLCSFTHHLTNRQCQSHHRLQ